MNRRLQHLIPLAWVLVAVLSGVSAHADDAPVTLDATSTVTALPLTSDSTTIVAEPIAQADPGLPCAQPAVGMPVSDAVSPCTAPPVADAPDNTLAPAAPNTNIVVEQPAPTLGTLPPLVSLVEPPVNSQFLAGRPYTIKAAVSSADLEGAGIDKVEVRFGVDAPELMAVSALPGIYERADVVPVNTGNQPALNTITLTAYDKNGTTTSVSQTFTILPANGTGAAFTQNFDVSKYDIFYGDFDRNGTANDIYLRGKRQYRVLGTTDAVPIVVDEADSFDFYESDDHSHSEAVFSYYRNDADLAAMGAVLALPDLDYVSGDLNNDGIAELLVRGRGLADSALLLNGTLAFDGRRNAVVYLGDIDSTGRFFTRSQGWSLGQPFTGNVSDRTRSLTITGGKINFAGKAYDLNTRQGLTLQAPFTPVAGTLGVKSFSMGAPVSFGVAGTTSTPTPMAIMTVSSAITGVQKLTYRYNALGRLVRTVDAVNGTRVYEYDAAGNRKNLCVLQPGATSCPVLPHSPYVDMPTGLWSGLIANCAYKGSWNAAINATYYLFRDTLGNQTQTTQLSQTVNCSLYPGGKPLWVQACNTLGCSEKAYF